MAKQLLTGTLDEQCEFLYTLAQEKMQQGNYTVAVHALKEVVKYAPDYRDAAELLAVAQQRKAMHSRLLWFAIAGATILIGVGTLLQIRNDLILLLLALVGAVLGYLAGNFYRSRRQAPTA